MKNSIKTVILALFLFIFAGSLQAQGTLKIALSKGSGGQSYENYSNWLEYYGYDVEFVDLHVQEQPLTELSKCDGLVLTGGPDIAPGRFGKAEEADRCSIDLNRDTLEFKALEYAFKNKMPVLGICRGQQLINVELGGSLIIDIPEDVENNVVHQKDNGDAHHDVIINKNSMLYKLSNKDISEVNSNHHQAVDQLASPLLWSSKTKDGINEAYEWKNPEGKSWMMAVEWHPERLDREDKLSKPIAVEFLKSVIAYKKN